VWARRTTRLQAKLEREQRRDAAWLEYRSAAQKRLYEEAEPLLFQSFELAEEARSRIESIAWSARDGYLAPDGSGWLAGPGYFYKSTAFMLLAPITSYKVLQRRLTAIDLGLEPRIATQYELLKLIFLSFTRDFDLARAADLTYKPDEADPGRRRRRQLLREAPQVYWRQGLYRGIVEMVAEALVTPTEGGEGPGARAKTLGEFWRELDDRDSAIGRQAGEIEALLGGFHPLRKPVLWHVLVAQHRLYDVFLATKGSESSSVEIGALEERVFDALDWRSKEAGEVSDEAVRSAVERADAYVRQQVTKRVASLRRTPAAR
jgi:hypothetical protein